MVENMQSPGVRGWCPIQKSCRCEMARKRAGLKLETFLYGGWTT